MPLSKGLVAERALDPGRRNCKLTDYSQQVIGAPNLCSLPQVLLAHADHVQICSKQFPRAANLCT